MKNKILIKIKDWIYRRYLLLSIAYFPAGQL